jgi:hypothetical protein
MPLVFLARIAALTEWVFRSFDMRIVAAAKPLVKMIEIEAVFCID